jgi:hypothetical protein
MSAAIMPEAPRNIMFVIGKCMRLEGLGQKMTW